MRLLTLSTILVATDLTETSDAALLSAARLLDASGGELHVVHVTSERDASGTLAGKPAELLRAIDQGMRRVGAKPKPCHPHILGGDPPASIAALAARVAADVVVLGRHDEGRPRAAHAVGGTAYAVLTGSDVPCLVVTQPLAVPAERILVGIDHSETARGALMVALSWASGLRRHGTDKPGARLIAIHVGPERSQPDGPPPRSADDEIDLIRRMAVDWARVDVQRVSVAGDDPATAIARYARDHAIDLVVLGTRGLSIDQARRLGSVSAAVTSQLEVPVLLVPPAVWRMYARDFEHYAARTTVE